eukprot:1150168-Pelagomonas_calceolata.AAC.2
MATLPAVQPLFSSLPPHIQHTYIGAAHLGEEAFGCTRNHGNTDGRQTWADQRQANAQIAYRLRKVYGNMSKRVHAVIVNEHACGAMATYK